MIISAKRDISAFTTLKTVLEKIKTTNSSLKSKNQSLHDYNNGVDVSKNLIKQALKQRIDTIDPNICGAGDENTFYVADLGEVYRQHLRWKINLPRIRPFYAVKCNPDPQVIRLLSKLGAGFDCASITEIQQVLEINTDADSIIYAHPCKTSSYVRYAASKGVKKMTFDSIDELYKIKNHFPKAKLFLRIATDDSSSKFQLSKKYGAHMNTTGELLDLAQTLGLCVVGVSFHIGSGASDPQAFKGAVRNSRTVFDQAAARGMNLHTLDIGGGFCSNNFESMARSLNQAIEDYISPHTTIIGEPGQYYVATAFTISSHVIGRRPIEDLVTRTTSYMLFLNDGTYGNFTAAIIEGQNFQPRVLRAGKKFYYDEEAAKPKPCGIEYSVWGPTCCSLDCISEKIFYECNLDIGDWLYFENMGAYTSSLSTCFNGFTNAFDVIYVVSEPGARSLLNINDSGIVC